MTRASHAVRWTLLLLAALPAFALSVSATAPALAGTAQIVVTRQFGGALRATPSSDADVVYTVPCGTVLTVIRSRQGWYQVSSAGGALWIGGARVAQTGSGASYDCSNARTFQIGDTAVTYVPTGCLSLRYTPSRSAGYDSCVNNGHLYTIESGPIEVSGEDWFEVWSPSTGDGWSLAQYLYTTS